MAVLAAALVLGACTPDHNDGQPTPGPTVSGPTSQVLAAPEEGSPKEGTPGAKDRLVGVRLSAGKAPVAPDPVPVVTGSPLDPDGITAVTDRLPAWKPEDLTKAFNWPVESIRPPAVGKTIKESFPPAEQKPPVAVPTGPLKVLRSQPHGTVTIAPFVSITFNQPMVPITTVGRLAATDVPVTITPEVPGHWQWIGTSTLRFDADSEDFDRMPMATEYTVTVPAGTKSATGAALSKAVTVNFTTPGPVVKSLTPTGTDLPLAPVFVATFNQQVDPAAVLAKLTVAAGGSAVSIRLATEAEVAADKKATEVTGKLQTGRWVAFRPVSPLPADTAVRIDLAAGLPSAEGPLTSVNATSVKARTYAPFTLKNVQCYDGCRSGDQVTVRLSNAVDLATFRPSDVTVSPAVEGLDVQADGNQLYLYGALVPRATYRVTVADSVTDVFGQTLVGDRTGTFTVGSERRRMNPLPVLTTLRSDQANPSIFVDTVNRTQFRVRVFQVAPADWGAFSALQQRYADDWFSKNTVLSVPDWPVLSDDTVTVTGATGANKDKQVVTPIDLTAAFAADSVHGHLVVLVEPAAGERFPGGVRWQNGPTMTWVQRTAISLDAVVDSGHVRVWATDLRDGSPLAGVTVSPLGITGDPAATDEHGVAVLALSASSMSAVTATLAGDTAILPADLYGGGWQSNPRQDELRWLVNDDRQTYRPGERASIKGWVRMLTSGSDSQITAVAAGSTVGYTVSDAYGNKIAAGSADVGALGGFDFTVDIPAGASTGEAYVELTLSGQSGLEASGSQHTFQIADYRRPDFEVTATPQTAGPYVLDDPVTVGANATYYAGGPLGAAGVNWQVRTAPATYSPPGWDQYTFGIWTPWWQTDTAWGGETMGYGDYCCDYPGGAEPVVDEFDGTTDAEGKQFLQIEVGDLGADNAGLPVTLTAQATVTDVNRQAIAGTADLLVHPGKYYVGLGGGSTFVRQGEDLSVSAIVTDVDGAVAPGRTVKIRAALVTTSWASGSAVETESDPQTCELTSTGDPVVCTVRPTTGGTYKITATVADDQGRTSRSVLTRWVAGAAGGEVDRTVQQQALTLVPDKAEYQPGESAQILVNSPVAEGTGLLTLSRGDVVSTSTFPVTGGSAVVSVPVADKDIPTINVSIEVAGAGPAEPAAEPAPAGPEAAARPSAFATGALSLAISSASRKLAVTVAPQATTVPPGADTSVEVTVRDAAGNPVPDSEFELMVVDEAVLALSDYRLPDPAEVFYAPLPNQVYSVFGRESVQNTQRSLSLAGGRQSGWATDSAYASSSETSTVAAMAGVPDSSNLQAGQAIKVRQAFDALAVFEPSVRTDAEGRATVDVPLPESLTRYRVMVVAVAGADRFGTAEANITASLPLTVRPTAPRFLNFGDTFELPVLVQNLGSSDLSVDVVLQTENLTATTANSNVDAAGQRVTVPADGRVEVRFPASAAEVGTARFRVAVAPSDPGAAGAGATADAITVKLPVYTPATSETFAGYGVIDGGKAVRQPVLAPTGVIPEFGGLTVSTSTTALQELTDAVLYLTDYRYESSDGLAAQVMAISSLGQVLAAFEAPGLPSPADLKKQVEHKIEQLAALQNADGGFPYWQKGERSEAFNSIGVVQALLAAEAQGYTVSADTLSRALKFLAEVRRHIPKNTSPSTGDTIQAYALNVRQSGGAKVAEAANTLYTERGASLSLDARAWLLPVLTDQAAISAITMSIQNAAVDRAGSVTFTNKAVDDAWTVLQSNSRTDALILDALIAVDPQSDLIPKIVAGAMGARQQGRWENVQENSFSLLALKHYFDTFESVTPDLVARVWLGDRFAGEHTYRGRTTEQAEITVPTADLGTADGKGVTIDNDGTGRLYYRIGLRTAPADFDLDPLDRGFVVTRTYQGVTDKGDVTRDGDGTWHVKAGAEVRVTVSMVAESARNHVALVDPLPAGLEILNADLAVTPKNLRKSMADRWSWSWFDHQNQRDDRAEAFSRHLGAGVYEYSYLARATTIGDFVVPPTRAEEMYSPETFGRSGSDSVVVEP
ncbi:hypothetical protein D1871_14730 [Nakamurella silvestris]|nr:hypothetical protein D1871_14730 [Nakamurella silvestris]